ncbi:activating transcription factor 7-interacting protein 1-like [Stegodyphus dumicola]|uniref:activating transcription factor 7-interacting protein 1-like n=1 Tax=Stegodyphus dumicola TaxID=202533 RepID=UPI0015A9AFAE|nr:activating transcription factor 7-interacting protein 1-like [Stegodyphus dumicola]
MPAVPSTVSKVNHLPSLANNSNLLVPISNFLQIIPPSQSISQTSLNNPMQMTRQSFIPPLQSGLIGQRAVAVQLNVGPRNIPVQSFNQRLPTYFLRVTNPATAASINTPVNSSPKMAVSPLPSSSISSPQPSSGLILISRTTKHPAPFPPVPSYPPNAKLKAPPPQPSLKGSKAPNGIILSWNMNLFNSHAEIGNYQLFAYQETSGPVTSSLWKKVGDVKALPLPMACTLTQFVEGHRYYFTVRAVDIYLRMGPYSDPVSIMYTHQETDTAASK